MTDVAIALPKEVAHQIESRWGNLPQRALESLAIEAYRSGIITTAEVQRMLGMDSGWDVDDFLKRAHAYLDYAESDLDRDVAAMRMVRRS
ncbi:MAG: UPF0175 family protein [Acidobacteriota bacterium]